jgi:hypothetical protein
LARSALDGKEAASRSLRFGASGESVPVSFKKLIADVRSAALTPSSVLSAALRSQRLDDELVDRIHRGDG